MATNISPELEQFIQHELETGTYGSREELLDQAVRLLKHHGELRRDVQAGIDSGPSVSAKTLLTPNPHGTGGE